MTVDKLGDVARQILLACLTIGAVTAGTADCHEARQREGKIPAAYFGLHFHRLAGADRNHPTTSWPREPFGSWRLWDAGVSWPALEPRRGDWDFGRLDRYVTLAESGNVDLLLPLGLSPEWASARPQEPSAYGPGNASEPRDLRDWRDYVRTVGLRYRGRIRAYEIWNEPNLPRFYSGTVPQIVNLLRVAYEELKGIDSTIVVVSPSPTGARGTVWLQKFLQQGGSRWCDVIGLHAYVGEDQTPEAMADLIQNAREYLDRNGLSARQLWNTETGWQMAGLAVGQDGSRTEPATGLDSAAAAAYVGRAMLLGWIAGADRFYWYAWDNARMGLVLTDGKTETPAARAYGTVATWLTGAQVLDHERGGDGIHRVRIQLQGERPGLLVWSEKRDKVSFLIPPAARTVRDLDGNTASLPSARDRTIEIDSRMILLEE